MLSKQSHWLQNEQRPISLCNVVNDACKGSISLCLDFLDWVICVEDTLKTCWNWSQTHIVSSQAYHCLAITAMILQQNLTVLYSMSSICSRAISVLSALICWLALSWFTVTLFLMLRALLAYFSVFRVSMKSWSDGLMQAIIIVRLRNQRESPALFIYSYWLMLQCQISIFCLDVDQVRCIAVHCWECLPNVDPD